MPEKWHTFFQVVFQRERMGAGVPHGLQNRSGFEKGPGGFDSYTFPPIPLPARCQEGSIRSYISEEMATIVFALPRDIPLPAWPFT
jgi:hypothetical protein